MIEAEVNFPINTGIETAPVFIFDTVSYQKDQKKIEKALSKILRYKVLGIDCEFWMLQEQQQILSCVQIATGKEVYIFESGILEEKNDKIASGFIKFLASPFVVKAGFSVKQDCSKIREALNIRYTTAGIFDLGMISELRLNTFNIRHEMSLADAAFSRFGIIKQKSPGFKNPEWNENQVYYAAFDAWFSRKIFMDQLRKKELVLGFSNYSGREIIA